MNKITKVERVFIEVHKDYDYTVETSGGYFHLKEQNNKYLLDEEQIIKLISDAFKKSFNVKYQSSSEEHIKQLEIIKEQYIKQILNNE